LPWRVGKYQNETQVPSLEYSTVNKNESYYVPYDGCFKKYARKNFDEKAVDFKYTI